MFSLFSSLSGIHVYTFRYLLSSDLYSFTPAFVYKYLHLHKVKCKNVKKKKRQAQPDFERTARAVYTRCQFWREPFALAVCVSTGGCAVRGEGGEKRGSRRVERLLHKGEKSERKGESARANRGVKSAVTADEDTGCLANRKNRRARVREG